MQSAFSNIQSHNNRPQIDEFAKVLCSQVPGSNLGRVSYKFVCNMLTGIRRTKSVNLTSVARGLNEKIRLHATHKRLSRNLDDPKLTKNLSLSLLKMGAKNVSLKTRLIVHTYELHKKYACKIEYLPKSLVDSESAFKVCEILASDPDSNTYTPLLARVWSDRVPNYESDAQEIKNAIMQVQTATGGRGMFFLDDETVDTGSIRAIVSEPSLDFIALVRDHSFKAVHGTELHSLGELSETVETKYGKMMFKLVPEGLVGNSKTDMDLFMHAGSIPIRLPQCSRRLSLIALKSSSRLTGEASSPLLTSQIKLRSRKAVMGLVESYLSIKDIISLHSAFRETFDPSGFRVLTYNRLQLLITLLQTVIHYETSIEGSLSISEKKMSTKPHDGEIQRTYYRPELSAQASQIDVDSASTTLERDRQSAVYGTHVQY